MKDRYIKNIILSFALQVFENCRSFILVPVIAKTIGASGYGIWVQMKIAIAFLTPYILLGLPEGLGRFLPGNSKERNQRDISSSFAAALFNGTLLFVSIMLLEPFIKSRINFLQQPGLFIKGIALLCVAEPLNALSLEYFKSFRKMKALLVLAMFDTLLEFLPVFWFAYRGFGISVIVFSFALARFLTAAVKTALIFKEIGLGRFNLNSLKELVKFGFPLTWVYVFYFIPNYLDRYLLEYFYSAKEVGIYSFAYTIGYTAVLLSAPWDRVMTPTITEHWNLGRNLELKRYFNSTLRYLLVIAVPFIVIFCVFAQEIINVLSTTEFLPARSIIPVIFASFLIFQMGVFYHRVVILTHDSFVIAKVFGLTAVISFLLNLILIPRFSITGATVSLLISHLVLFFVFYKLAIVKVKEISFDWLLLAKSSLAAAPIFLIYLISRGNFWAMITGVVFSIIIYFTLLAALKVIGIKEWVYLIDLWRRPA